MYTIDKILISMKEYLDCMLDTQMLKDINVVLDSVKKDKEAVKGDLVITLLRIEEETSRKPQNIYFRKEKGVEFPTSPDLDINLEVLISAPVETYETSLTLISKVISILNSIKTAGKPEGMSDESYNLIYSMNISLMGMPFDQMLTMWQTLGGTLVPSVAYKVRMITVPGLNEADAAHVVGKGKISVEMGEMDAVDKELKSLTTEEKSKMTKALAMEEKQEKYVNQMEEQLEKQREEKKKKKWKESDESKDSIQIREK